MAKGFVETARWLAQPKVGLVFVVIMLIAILIGVDILHSGGPVAIAAVWFAFVPVLLITVAVGSIALDQRPVVFARTSTRYRAGRIQARLELLFRPPRLQLKTF